MSAEQQALNFDAVPHFDGRTYVPPRDHDRLAAQLGRVRDAMRGAGPLTLAALAEKTGDPEASVSARLRDLRKAKFGGHVVRRTYVERGLFRYELDPQPTNPRS